MMTADDLLGSLLRWRGVIVGQLGAVLDHAVAIGEDASRTATRFRSYATGAFARRRDAAGRLVRPARIPLPDVYPARPGMATAGARQLLRIGIGEAHREGAIAAAEATPGTGVRWIVAHHAKPDECDTIANRDSGHGPGLYLPGRVPSRPHAGCQCHTVVVALANE